MTKQKRVLLGMSGGVDSSVAAALLKQKGYDVIGITMQLLPNESEKRSACCNIDSITDAKRVAAKLNIPHYTLNIRDNFKHHVIDYFVNEYSNGRTPNPCVECNRYIKFDELLKKADELNADYVATGHYCKRTKHPQKDLYYLKKAKDAHKDQTYFLYMLDQKRLKRTLFPLGNLLKSEIRELALEFGLITAKKKESQEICFVTQGSYKDFIDSQLNHKNKPGDILDIKGNKLGTHTGIHHYTIGQKKGLNLNNHIPLHVIKIDAFKNTLTVAEADHLQTNIITIHNPVLINPNKNLQGKTISVKLRYQMVPFQAKVTKINPKSIEIKTSTPQKFITPGQSAVLYDKDFVLGGGILN